MLDLLDAAVRRLDARLEGGHAIGDGEKLLLLRPDRLKLLLRVEGPRENRVTLTLQGVELGAAVELLRQLAVHFGSKRVQAVDPGLQFVDELRPTQEPAQLGMTQVLIRDKPG